MSKVNVRELNSLRAYVDARGTRYKKLADILSVSPSHINRLLDGKRRITEAQADVLAEFYGEPRATFLGFPFRGGDE